MGSELGRVVRCGVVGRSQHVQGAAAAGLRLAGAVFQPGEELRHLRLHLRLGTQARPRHMMRGLADIR